MTKDQFDELASKALEGLAAGSTAEVKAVIDMGHAMLTTKVLRLGKDLRNHGRDEWADLFDALLALATKAKDLPRMFPLYVVVCALMTKLATDPHNFKELLERIIACIETTLPQEKDPDAPINGMGETIVAETLNGKEG